MSRIGKQPIQIESTVTFEHKGDFAIVKGPKGEVYVPIPSVIDISIDSSQIIVRPKSETPQSRALWGLTRMLLANAVEGVTKGFQKELELVGVGYRVQKKGNSLELELGFSHKINVDPLEGIQLDIDKGTIRITGIDKQKVGQMAANIRSLRPPEPYKGKGIRYMGEYIKLKPGKSAKAASG
jgi:large subunit ribosomal protein L6